MTLWVETVWVACGISVCSVELALHYCELPPSATPTGEYFDELGSLVLSCSMYNMCDVWVEPPAEGSARSHLLISSHGSQGGIAVLGHRVQEHPASLTCTAAIAAAQRPPLKPWLLLLITAFFRNCSLPCGRALKGPPGCSEVTAPPASSEASKKKETRTREQAWTIRSMEFSRPEYWSG